MEEKVIKALLDSGLIYKAFDGGYYVGINGDTDVTQEVESIVADLTS